MISSVKQLRRCGGDRARNLSDGAYDEKFRIKVAFTIGAGAGAGNRSSTPAPGQIAELKFALQPISVLVKKGHRLRVAIAGHDKGTFIRIPAEGTPTIAVQRNKRGLSSLELPVIKK